MTVSRPTLPRSSAISTVKVFWSGWSVMVPVDVEYAQHPALLPVVCVNVTELPFSLMRRVLVSSARLSHHSTVTDRSSWSYVPAPGVTVIAGGLPSYV